MPLSEDELAAIEDFNNKICICCESKRCCDRSKKIPVLIAAVRQAQKENRDAYARGYNQGSIDAEKLRL